LHRITANYVRHQLTGYDRAWNQLAVRVGRQDAHEILRSAVNAAIEAKLAAGAARAAETAGTPEPREKVVEAALGDSR
jgi:hypothetical protein